MRHLIAIAALAALAGCGADTATTAATGAAIRKQEVEQGRQTMDQAQRRIGQVLDQAQQSSQRAGDDAAK